MAEKNKSKHDHNLTTKLKGCLFAVIMFLPIMAILSNILYITFNKNAKDSYTAEYTYIYKNEVETIELDNTQIEGTIYYQYAQNQTIAYGWFKTIELKTQPQSFVSPVEYKNVNNNTYKAFCFTTDSLIISEVDSIELCTVNNMLGAFAVERYWGNYATILFDIKIDTTSIHTKTENINKLLARELIQTTYKTESTLDNIYYSSTEKLIHAPLFNWVENTFAFTAIKAMCTGLMLENNFLIYLLTYWIMMSLIYVVFDIIIETFTFITHLFVSKK